MHSLVRYSNKVQSNKVQYKAVLVSTLSISSILLGIVLFSYIQVLPVGGIKEKTIAVSILYFILSPYLYFDSSISFKKKLTS